MKSSRFVRLAMFAMVVFGGLETASADPIYSFTTIDVPGAISTSVSGINNSGQIVGNFVDAAGEHGFVDTGGSFTTIDFPGYRSTNVYGINDSGQIVGDAQGSGFVDTGGSFTYIDVPKTFSTETYGINDSGQIVGVFGLADGSFHGFVNTGSTFFTTIDVPGARDTFAYGINNSGQIVGYFSDGTGPHGFVNTGGRFGSFITLPGIAYGINDNGQIVGSFGLDAAGTFTPINVPGASSTEAYGINDSGQIVGEFVDATGGHGFLATPAVATPEPPSLLTFATCLIALFTIAWRRKLVRARIAKEGRA